MLPNALPPAIAAAAAAAGVTRLADLTGLDVLGIPVWQAVRPWSLTVSVNQGKSFDPAVARIAAAMEAVEVAAAERVGPAVQRSCWSDIDPACRSGSPDDFARKRGGISADRPIDWILGERVADGAPFLVPRDAVLLDFTKESLDHDCVEVSSNGQGAHLSLEAATLKGLLEIVERDAMGEAFLSDRNLWRMGRVSVEPGIWPWFDTIVDRVQAAGISLWLYEFKALAGARVLACEMRDPAAFPSPRAIARGVAAAMSVEQALRGAVAEAAQVRLTDIAFAREDLTGRVTGKRIESVPPYAFVAEPGLLKAEMAPAPSTAGDQLTSLVVALAAGGYPDIVRVRLPTEADDVHAVRMFVPGLGSAQRARRLS